MCYIVLKVEKGEGRRSVSASFQTQQEPPHTQPTPGKSQSLARAENTSGLCARRRLLRAKAQQELLPLSWRRCSQPAAVPTELSRAAGPASCPSVVPTSHSSPGRRQVCHWPPAGIHSAAICLEMWWYATSLERKQQDGELPYKGKKNNKKRNPPSATGALLFGTIYFWRNLDSTICFPKLQKNLQQQNDAEVPAKSLRFHLFQVGPKSKISFHHLLNISMHQLILLGLNAAVESSKGSTVFSVAFCCFLKVIYPEVSQ